MSPDPINLTPADNYLPADARTVPDEAEDIKLVLAAGVAGSKLLERDLKFARFKASGGALKFNVSYTDGSNEAPGNLTGGSDTRLKELADGETYDLPQNKEFNKVWGLSAGGATLIIYPGDGIANELT